MIRPGALALVSPCPLPPVASGRVIGDRSGLITPAGRPPFFKPRPPRSGREGGAASESVSVAGADEFLPVRHLRFDNAVPNWCWILYGVVYVLANCKLWKVYLHEGNIPRCARGLNAHQVEEVRRMEWMQAISPLVRQCALSDLEQYGHAMLGCPTEAVAQELIRQIGRLPDFLSLIVRQPSRWNERNGKR